MFGDHSKKPNRWAAIAITAALLAQPAAAEQTNAAADITAKRIALAGNQRMLAETMAKSLCFVQSDIEAETHRADLVAHSEIYARTHQALLDGDTTIGIPAEQQPAAIQHWRDVDRVWTEMADLSSILIADLRAQHAQELEGTGGIVTGLLIDLYERQLMLGELLTKEVCLIARDFQTDKTRAKLDETIVMLVNSMAAFQDGMPQLGIPAAPTQDVADRLASAQNSLHESLRWRRRQKVASLSQRTT
ncbi:type IV pili methyl-accepting chemotaxis transducer N-terminal domain-containing protein [Halovulum sp. GXIMD14793]